MHRRLEGLDRETSKVEASQSVRGHEADTDSLGGQGAHGRRIDRPDHGDRLGAVLIEGRPETLPPRPSGT